MLPIKQFGASANKTDLLTSDSETTSVLTVKSKKFICIKSNVEWGKVPLYFREKKK